MGHAVVGQLVAHGQHQADRHLGRHDRRRQQPGRVAAQSAGVDGGDQQGRPHQHQRQRRPGLGLGQLDRLRTRTTTAHTHASHRNTAMPVSSPRTRASSRSGDGVVVGVSMAESGGFGSCWHASMSDVALDPLPEAPTAEVGVEPGDAGDGVWAPGAAA